jgi:hypothetical protein
MIVCGETTQGLGDLQIGGLLLPRLAISGRLGTRDDLLPPRDTDQTLHAFFPDGDRGLCSDVVLLGTVGRRAPVGRAPAMRRIPPAQVAARMVVDSDADMVRVAGYVRDALRDAGLRRAFTSDVRVYAADGRTIELWWTFVPRAQRSPGWSAPRRGAH